MLCCIPLFLFIGPEVVPVKFAKSLHLHAALVFICVSVSYYSAIFAPFISIDDLRLIHNLQNIDDFTFKQLFFPNGSGTYYRPLLYLTFIIDKYLWGLEASFMHLENILLHLGNSLFVLLLARLLFATLSIEAPLSALAAALLFGLHPLATEPVNWVSGRTDLLAGFFVLAALFLFIKSICTSSFRYGLFSALLLFAGCLSKETALFAIPVLLLWTAFPPREIFPEFSLKLRCFLFGLFTAAGCGYLLLRWWALHGGDRVVQGVHNIETTLHDGSANRTIDVVLTVVKAAGFYFKKLLFPLPLNFGIHTVSSHYFWLGLLVVAGVVWCLLRRGIIAYLLIAAFMLTSSAFILPLLKVTWTPYAERYLYIAAAPFILAITLAFHTCFTRMVPLRLTTALVVIILGSAAMVTVQRNLVWLDNYTLFKDTIEKSPGVGAIVNEYAVALRERGEIEKADKIMLSNEVDEFQQSSLNKIRVLTINGQLMEARTLLLQRLNKNTEYKPILLELLVTIDESRRVKAAQESEQQAIDRELLGTMNELQALTGDPFYHYRIGRLQLVLKNRSEAKSSFLKAWQGSPPNSHYHDAAKKLAERL